MRAANDKSATVGERLKPFASPWTLFALLAATALLLLAFNRFPSVDIAVSRWFFTSQPCNADQAAASACGFFGLRDLWWFPKLRQGLQALPFVLAVGLGLFLLVRLMQGARVLSAEILACSAVFWSYVLSAGLVVNVVLKEYSGRPRPIYTVLFGGDVPFVPAGRFTGFCDSNCSFVSGEAAASAWLIALAAFLPAPWRSSAMATAAVIAVATSALRVSFGAHFFSDVITGGLVTLTIFSVCAVVASRIELASPSGPRRN